MKEFTHMDIVILCLMSIAILVAIYSGSQRYRRAVNVYGALSNNPIKGVCNV
jgi:hypothetical protein